MSSDDIISTAALTSEMIAAGARPLREFGLPGELAEHLARRVFLEMTAHVLMPPRRGSDETPMMGSVPPPPAVG